MCTGAPWTRGNPPVISTALGTSATRIGRMLTTSGPEKGPDASHAREVMYMGTFCFSVMCLTSIDAFSRASSKEKEHPSLHGWDT